MDAYTKHELTGVPFITVKVAQSLDGRIACEGGDSRWISSSATREVAHRLRSDHDGVMVGIGTVLKDDPQLTVRLVEGKNPCRIVVDSNLRIPPNARIITDKESCRTIIATTSKADGKNIAVLESLGAQVLIIEKDDNNRVNLRTLLGVLGEKGISSILIEGGSEIITTLLRDNLVDKLVVIIAPKIIGQGIESVKDLGIRRVNEAITFSETKVDTVGADIVFEGIIAHRV